MSDEIRAEMVANVWKVVAAAGDSVAEGDTLVILESMKMEIPVLAETDGTVAELALATPDLDPAVRKTAAGMVRAVPRPRGRSRLLLRWRRS